MDLHSLLEYGIEQKASDLHLSPGQFPILRVDGDLLSLNSLPKLDADKVKQLVFSAMDKEKQNILESSLELDFAFVLPNIGSFRVNAFHEINGVSAVFRVIPSTIPTLDSIGTPPVLKELLELSAGLILVTGPTGCGKSTTLAAMIDYINTQHNSHIITIEDPIEFVHESKKSLIHQRQIFRDSASFSTALRSALREDPDVILVGEMRDLETIRLALTAA